MKIRGGFAAATVVVMVLSVGCGGGDPVVSACTPGQSTSCVCAGGHSGVQTCQAGGTYAACSCTEADAGGGVDAPDVISVDVVDAGPSAVDAPAPDVPMDAGLDVPPAIDVPAMPVDVPPSCPAPQVFCVGQCASLPTDPMNCGACGTVCPPRMNAVPACAGSMCGFICNAGFRDCDGNPLNGCETNITTTSNCGACGVTCGAAANAAPSCAADTCGITCNTGFANCDGSAGNGCEVNTTSSNAHCGACGNACAGGMVCLSGSCACPSGQTACGGACVVTASSATNCGSCGNACASGSVCLAGTCIAQVSCPDSSERGCGLVQIDGGSFAMGATDGAIRATPIQVSISVSSFSMDAYLVTVGRFRRFWNAGHPSPTGAIVYPGGSLSGAVAVAEPRATPRYGGTCNWTATAGSRELHPVNCVNRSTAQAFCVWDGGRLPTEAEWEYAARGRTVAGLSAPRSFPWGNTVPSASPCDLAHFNACAGDDGANTRQVGRFPAQGGLYDMAGNLWEWMADRYVDYSNSTCWGGTTRSNPLCTSASAPAFTVRGGWWGNPSDTLVNNTALLRSASRGYDPPEDAYEGLGFRCVRSP